MSDDFYDSLGYELPKDIPDKIESTGGDFYKHPLGIYIGPLGRLIPKYKDIEGKSCEQDTPGATLSHLNLIHWLTRYLGTAEHPEQKELLGNGFKMPEDITPYEVYYSGYISLLPKHQWGLHKAFADLQIPNKPEYNIVKQSTEDKVVKYTDLHAFRAYYGLYVQFELTETKGGFRYTTGYKLLELPRVPIEKMRELEETVNGKVEELKKQREADNQSSNAEYIPDESASTNPDDVLGDFSENNPNEDLPF